MLGPNFVGFDLKARRLYPTNMGFNPLDSIPRGIIYIYVFSEVTGSEATSKHQVCFGINIPELGVFFCYIFFGFLIFFHQELTDISRQARCPMPLASLLRDRFVASQNAGRGSWNMLHYIVMFDILLYYVVLYGAIL